jgi:hypothetical protein
MTKPVVRFEQSGTPAHRTWAVVAEDETGPIDLAPAIREFTLTANARGEVSATITVVQPELLHTEVPEDRVAWAGLERVPEKVLIAELRHRNQPRETADERMAGTQQCIRTWLLGDPEPDDHPDVLDRDGWRWVRTPRGWHPPHLTSPRTMRGPGYRWDSLDFPLFALPDILRAYIPDDVLAAEMQARQQS